jgi:hypothetical protein
MVLDQSYTNSKNNESMFGVLWDELLFFTTFKYDY